MRSGRLDRGVGAGVQTFWIESRSGSDDSADRKGGHRVDDPLKAIGLVLECRGHRYQRDGVPTRGQRPRLALGPVRVVEHWSDVADVVGQLGWEVEAARRQHEYLAGMADLIPEVMNWTETQTIS